VYVCKDDYNERNVAPYFVNSNLLRQVTFTHPRYVNRKPDIKPKRSPWNVLLCLRIFFVQCTYILSFDFCYPLFVFHSLLLLDLLFLLSVLVVSVSNLWTVETVRSQITGLFISDVAPIGGGCSIPMNLIYTLIWSYSFLKLCVHGRSYLKTFEFKVLRTHQFFDTSKSLRHES